MEDNIFSLPYFSSQLLDLWNWIKTISISSISLDQLVNLITIIQRTLTTLAIIIGGFWSYLLFIRKRQKYPRANLSHTSISKQLTKEKILLHVSIQIFNPGEVLLSLRKGEVWIQQILPPTPELLTYIEQGNDPVMERETEIKWHLLCERSSTWKKNRLEIEPGETHSLNYDFIIDSRITCIEIHSRYWNIMKAKRDFVWSLVTIHDLDHC